MSKVRFNIHSYLSFFLLSLLSVVGSDDVLSYGNYGKPIEFSANQNNLNDVHELIF